MLSFSCSWSNLWYIYSYQCYLLFLKKSKNITVTNEISPSVLVLQVLHVLTKYYGGSIVYLALHCGDNHKPAFKIYHYNKQMRCFIMAIIIFSHRCRASGLSLQKVCFLKIKDMICVSQNCRFCGRTEKGKLNRELCFAVPWIRKSNTLKSFKLKNVSPKEVWLKWLEGLETGNWKDYWRT